MPRFSDDVSTSGAVRANDGVFTNGLHGDGHFDRQLGLRKAQSIIHEPPIVFRVNTGVAVATVQVPLYGAQEVEEIVAVQVIPEAKPTGDYQYTVDLEKGNGGAAYATVLSGALLVNSSSANRTAQLATIDATKKMLADGDSLRLNIQATGSSGGQGTGLVVTIITRKRPQP